MKIYTEIRIDMTSLEVLGETSFGYDGPVAECKGGGTVQSTDPEYNQGLLALQQEDSAMTRQMFNRYMYGVDYDPSETVTGYMDADGNFIESDTAPSAGGGGGGSSQRQQYPDRQYREDNQGWYYLEETGGQSGGSTRKVRVEGDPTATPVSTDPAAEGAQLVTKTRGDLEGYDDSIVSGADYSQMAIESQARLLGGETEAALSDTNLAYETSEMGRRLLPGQEAVANAQLGLEHDTAMMEREFIPGQTAAGLSALELQNAENLANLGLVDVRAGMERSNIDTGMLQNEATRAATRAKMPVTQKFFDQALNGVDVNRRVNQAHTDTAIGFKNADRDMRQNAALMGVNPNSGRFKGAMVNNSLNKAKAIGGARSGARERAENENFGRLSKAMQY